MDHSPPPGVLVTAVELARLDAAADVPRGKPEPLDPFEAAILFAIRRAAAKRRRRMTVVGGSDGGRTI